MTNVRGPQQPTYFCGQEIKYLSPIIPIGGGLRTVVGINSYNGVLNIAITGDSPMRVRMLLLAGIQEGIDEPWQCTQVVRRFQPCRALGPCDIDLLEPIGVPLLPSRCWIYSN